MEDKFMSMFNEHDSLDLILIDDDYEEWLANFEKKQLEEELGETTITTRSKSL